MYSRLIVAFAFVMASGATARAQQETQAATPHAPAAQPRVYAEFDVGPTSINYPAGKEDWVLDAPIQSDATRLQLALGFSVYRTLGERGLIGIAFSADGDRADDSSSARYLNFYLAGPSFVHSFGESQRKGFLVRADVGIAWSTWGLDASNDLHWGADDGSSVGVGALVGVGYSFALGRKVMVPLQVRFTGRVIDGDTSSSIAGTVGIAYGF
jgi:hypothetical protein